MNGGEQTQEVVILGAGGTGLLIADSISRSPHSRLVGFLDDDEQKKGVTQGKSPVLGTLSFWKSLSPKYRFISSLYGPKRNVEFYFKIRSLGIPEDRWTNVVDASAIVSSSAALGHGVYVGPATVLEPNVSLGNWSAMLGGVCIAHDTRIDTYVAYANSVSIAGGVKVESAAFVGVNATIREYLQIGRCAVIGMGAVILRDIPDGTVAAGNPCKTIGNTMWAESLRGLCETVNIHAKPIAGMRLKAGTGARTQRNIRDSVAFDLGEARL